MPQRDTGAAERLDSALQTVIVHRTDVGLVLNGEAVGLQQLLQRDVGTAHNGLVGRSNNKQQRDAAACSLGFVCIAGKPASN